MHRWFRFCGRIALVSATMSAAVAAAFLLPVTASGAESPTDSPAPSTPAAPEPAPIPLPTPGKHQLKVTPLQMVQHQTEVLAQKLETQASLIVSLTQQIEEQNKEIETLKEQNETLATNLSVLEGQFSNLNDTVEELEAGAADTSTSTSTAAATPSTSVSPGSHSARIVKAATTTEAASDAFALPVESEEPDTLPPASGRVHIVERGENLTVIARKYGTTAGDLLKLNNIRDERKLQIGQELMLPAGTAPAPAPAQ